MLRKRWNKLKEILKSSEDDEKRQLYQELIEKVVVYPNGYVEVVLRK